MLTAAEIHAAPNDEALIDLLNGEIHRLIPTESFADDEKYFDAVDVLPPGLRAMQGVYSLEVSMSFDDLAWHFLNHPSERSSQLIYNGLLELELAEVATLFKSAWDIMQPHLVEFVLIRNRDSNWHLWLKTNGLQSPIDPLNERLWEVIDSLPQRLPSAWAIYARKYPERCIAIP